MLYGTFENCLSSTWILTQRHSGISSHDMNDMILPHAESTSSCQPYRNNDFEISLGTVGTALRIGARYSLLTLLFSIASQCAFASSRVTCSERTSSQFDSKLKHQFSHAIASVSTGLRACCQAWTKNEAVTLTAEKRKNSIKLRGSRLCKPSTVVLTMEESDSLCRVSRFCFIICKV